MSCHFSLSWHCQKIQGWGWLAGAGVPTHPVEKEREVSQLAVKRVHYATEYFLVIAIFCVFQNIHKLARQNQIFSKSRERKCSKVNMLNQSLDNQVHSQALYHDSAGFTLVNCSTMWIFSGELERILGGQNNQTVLENLWNHKGTTETVFCHISQSEWLAWVDEWDASSGLRIPLVVIIYPVTYVWKSANTVIMMASSQFWKKTFLWNLLLPEKWDNLLYPGHDSPKIASTANQRVVKIYWGYSSGLW